MELIQDDTKRYFKPKAGYVANIEWIELHKGDVIIQMLDGNRSLALKITPDEVEAAVARKEWTEYDHPPKGNLNTLAASVEVWGATKGILARSNPEKQFRKLLEEIEETGDAIEAEDQAEIIDGIGDCTVVLILLARLCGTDFEHCLRMAYEEIKDRKGEMVDGTFVKEKCDNSSSS